MKNKLIIAGGVLWLVLVAVAVTMWKQPEAVGNDMAQQRIKFQSSPEVVQLYADYKSAITNKEYLAADSIKRLFMSGDYRGYPEGDSILNHWIAYTNTNPEVKDIVALRNKAELEKIREEERFEEIADKRASLNTLNTLLINGIPVYTREAELTHIETWDNDMSTARRLGDKEIDKLIKVIEPKLKRHKAKRFPIIRREFVADVKQRLWRENIEVKIGGKNNSTITFIGGMFASNANKQDFHNEIRDALHKMRFKRAEYKWYKYDDEYTYYTMKSPADTD